MVAWWKKFTKAAHTCSPLTHTHTHVHSRSRKHSPILFCRQLLDQKIQARGGAAYAPEHATEYVRQCYADASANADESGLIQAKKTDKCRSTHCRRDVWQVHEHQASPYPQDHKLLLRYKQYPVMLHRRGVSLWQSNLPAIMTVSKVIDASGVTILHFLL